MNLIRFPSIIVAIFLMTACGPPPSYLQMKEAKSYSPNLSKCATTSGQEVVNCGNLMSRYSSTNAIRNQTDYESAKKLVENCECWTSDQGAFPKNTYFHFLEKTEKLTVDYEQWLF